MAVRSFREVVLAFGIGIPDFPKFRWPVAAEIKVKKRSQDLNFSSSLPFRASGGCTSDGTLFVMKRRRLSGGEANNAVNSLRVLGRNAGNPESSTAIVRNSSRFRGGITLVEIVIVVLVIGIMASMAVPRYSRQIQHRQVMSAAMLIISDLEQTRQRAISTSTTRSVTFDASAHAYSLTSESRYARGNNTATVQLNETPWSTQIRSISAGMSSASVRQLTVSFNGTGTLNENARIVLVSGNMLATVHMDKASGRIVIE